MKNCVFTIVATNYVGLAQALQKSIEKYNKDVDFYIVVADEPAGEVKSKLPCNVFVAKEILSYSDSKWYEMAFKYNLTEFCTAIKPASIQYFFAKSYNKVIYFDPDILTFDSLDFVWNKLNDYSAVVTPHILTAEVEYSGNLKEQRLLYSGVFNMGFGAFKQTRDVTNFLKWWKNRLEDYCFADSNLNLFTDQKWVDMLPCFLGTQLYVSRNKGMNVAPWNFHERKVIQGTEKLKIGSRLLDEELDNLIFVHYSGYNYKSLISGEVIQQNISDIKQYEDIIVLFNEYGSALKQANIAAFIDQKYTYNYFSNHTYTISLAVRRLFRGLVENGNDIENPFDCNSDFFNRLSSKGFVRKNQEFNSVVYNEQSQNTQKTISRINTLFGFVFKIIGADRYYNLTRALRKYGIWENHSFLITKGTESYKFRRL